MMFRRLSRLFCIVFLYSLQPPRREVNFKAANARAVIDVRQTPVAEESPQKKADYGKVPE
jgi:hypothetical protein